MLYPFAKTDLLPRRLLRTRLYRRINAWPITIGHLRVAELLENRLAAPDSPPPELLDFGQLIALTAYDWRTALRLIRRPALRFLWRRDRSTPRTVAEVEAAVKWLNAQRYWPARTAVPDYEQKAQAAASALASSHAASPAQRLALTLAAIPGALAILGIRNPLDATLPQATHLVVAHMENQGAHHVSQSLIADALAAQEEES